MTVVTSREKAVLGGDSLTRNTPALETVRAWSSTNVRQGGLGVHHLCCCKSPGQTVMWTQWLVLLKVDTWPGMRMFCEVGGCRGPGFRTV